jgi:phosphoglycolate phosphatase/AHBA synthesis associated protein
VPRAVLFDMNGVLLKSEEFLPTLLEAAHLMDCFEAVACADLVARSKPAPDLVLYALEKLGAAATEALRVGDSRYDEGAAGAAGVRFVGLGLDGDARIEQLSELLAHLTAPAGAY